MSITGDVADRADLEIERTTQEAIRLAAKREKPPKDWDKETCYEAVCGDVLPKERIEAQRYRCVTCQTLIEKKGR